MGMINYENLRNFAYSNDKLCKEPIRGIVLDFPGLGGLAMFDEDRDEGKLFAKYGIIYLIPYYNPWCWMNRQAVAYTDEIVSCIMNHYSLDESIPIVSSGGSMGGGAALTYMVYAAHTPAACVASCPVCDYTFHFKERKDLPRTFYSAFSCDPAPFEEAIKSASPVHLVDRMPDADYYIFHCEADVAVHKANHSDIFVEKMKAKHKITYVSVPERGHCDLPDDMKKLYNDYIVESIDKHYSK